MNGKAGEGFKQCFMQLDNIYTSKTASQRAEAGLTGGVTDAPLATFMERKNPENTTVVKKQHSTSRTGTVPVPVRTQAASPLE